MKLISRIILYPLCLFAAIWCWNGFRDAYENMQIARFGVELDEGEEIPAEGGSAETDGSDKAFDIDAVNRMLTNSTQDEVEDKALPKTELPAKGENTKQVDAVEMEPLETPRTVEQWFLLGVCSLSPSFVFGPPFHSMLRCDH